MSFEILDIEQGSEEWLELRRSCIGASDLPVLMGEIKGKTAYDLFLEKTGRRAPDPETYPMLRGKRLEPIARELAAEKFNVEFFTPVLRSTKTPWAIASLDGATKDFSLLLEVKAPHLSNYRKIVDSDKLPLKYFYQCQWQMYVADVRWMYCMLFSEQEHHFFYVERDEEVIKDLLTAAEDFIYYLHSDVEPPIELTTMKHLDTEMSYAAQKNWFEKDLRVKELETKLKEAIEERDLAKVELLDHTDGGDCEGTLVTIQWCEGRKTVGYKKIVEDLSIDEETLEKYTKISPPFATIKAKQVQDFRATATDD